MSDGSLSWRASKKKSDLEQKLSQEKRKQAGVSFPSAAKQEHLLVIRLDLQSSVIKNASLARKGLKRLCNFFNRIDRGDIEIDELSEDGSITQYKPSRYNFSATIGFGIGFFEKLNIDKYNRPRRLYSMPDHNELMDPFPYRLRQTDLILQLGSTTDFVNRWIFQNDSYDRVLENTGYHRREQYYTGDTTSLNNETSDANIHDIESSIKDWAIITDVHAGFQRLDGRNLMGFNDGISNPDRFNNNVIWTTQNDEDDRFRDGTYMVFQKIEHDLEKWKALGIREQEKWVGRSKATGLLLGTLSHDDDRKLALDCKSTDPYVRDSARKRLQNLVKEQGDPEKELYTEPASNNISIECPVWSHVRKSNPRGEDGAPKKIIFRRGYLFMTDAVNGVVSSGLLFICFQRDIMNGFEYVKKNFLNNKNFPIPEKRKNFSKQELADRHRHGRFSVIELQGLGSVERATLGMDSKIYKEAIEEAHDPDAQNTGREGLTGPSKLGIHPHGEFSSAVSLGGGYYFIPPIPNKSLPDIADQFFV